MALYLGSNGKQKIVLNGVVYNLNLFATTPIVNGVKLLSSEDYVLKDLNGLYITAKHEDNT